MVIVQADVCCCIRSRNRRLHHQPALSLLAGEAIEIAPGWRAAASKPPVGDNAPRGATPPPPTGGSEPQRRVQARAKTFHAWVCLERARRAMFAGGTGWYNARDCTQRRDSRQTLKLPAGTTRSNSSLLVIQGGHLRRSCACHPRSFCMSEPFLERLRQGPLLCDGAMGTVLYARAPESIVHGRCFDELVLTDPGLVQEIHRDYIRAGAQIIETNTFGANAVKLAGYGLAEKARLHQPPRGGAGARGARRGGTGGLRRGRGRPDGTTQHSAGGRRRSATGGAARRLPRADRGAGGARRRSADSGDLRQSDRSCGRRCWRRARSAACRWWRR